MGGGGQDSLEGGAGADVFRFDNPYESTLSAQDVISDFSGADGDLIDLSRLDADSTSDGHQAFQFQEGQAFSGRAGELRYADNVLSGDVNGNGSADFAIAITGAVNLGSDDFIL
jgi:Ca2+-binding RTX toxin-like protein